MILESHEIKICKALNTFGRVAVGFMCMLMAKLVAVATSRKAIRTWHLLSHSYLTCPLTSILKALCCRSKFVWCQRTQLEINVATTAFQKRGLGPIKALGSSTRTTPSAASCNSSNNLFQIRSNDDPSSEESSKYFFDLYDGQSSALMKKLDK